MDNFTFPFIVGGGVKKPECEAEDTSSSLLSPL